MIHNFKKHKLVKVVDSANKVVKRGLIMEVGTSFLKIWDKDNKFDHIDSCQWFPIFSQELRCISI